MVIERSSGLLLHITSLPGKYGIGTLGKEAYEFVDLLHAGGQKYWHLLPFNPVSAKFNYSPYASLSSFAGNPLFINVEMIDQEEWMKDDILSGLPVSNLDSRVNFEAIISVKMPYLRKAFENFLKFAGEDSKNYFNYFCQDQKYWLDDYALFASLSIHYDNFNWKDWDNDIAWRKPKSQKMWKEKLHSEIEFQKFLQFIFLKQWFGLKKYANGKGIRLIGELPFYTEFKSCETWCHPEIFELDRRTLLPRYISGFPGNDFGKKGEKWGNPLYRWFDGKKPNMNTVNWWIERVKHAMNFFDMIKLCFFRGFESSWSIPINEKNVENGKWEKGPGMAFFKRLKEKSENFSFIADNLKFNSAPAEKIKNELNIPGTKVLQHAFDSNQDNGSLPHNFKDSNYVVYTGTSDDNTANGWFWGNDMDDDARNSVMNYIGSDKWDEFHWQFIVLALGSIARMAIFPVQDVLGLDEENRMNSLKSETKNWDWKLTPEKLTPTIMIKLKNKCEIFGRI
jgi:4-alpha-glucanotransferase